MGARWWVLGLLAMAAALSSGAALPAAAQQRWAAIDPNNETSSPVVWGATEEEARRRAVEACKRLSKTCANGPASTDDMREVFALMCCTTPKLGCAAAAANGGRAATRGVQRMLADAGYTNCSVRHYMSAGTGKRQ